MSVDEDGDDDILSFTVPGTETGGRLDKVLATLCPDDLSRSRIKALILEEAVIVNDVVCADPSRKAGPGDEITVIVPPPVDDTPLPEDIPLNIVYEDDALLVIDKQAGMVVHPAPGHSAGTLVNALLYHCGDSLSGIGGVRRPGIVHRLDKDTSGLMVVAKTDKAHRGLAAQLKDRTLGRYYRALVWGVLQPLKGRIDQPVGRHHVNRQKMAVNERNGREAATRYHVLEAFEPTAALVECRLETGRTHQVRVHMAYMKHPLVGDPLYGIQRTGGEALLRKGGYDAAISEAVLNFPRQALHACEVHFTHPVTGTAMGFESLLPNDMKKLLSLL